MKKYAIEDLVVDTPEEEERKEKERKKEYKKNKEKEKKEKKKKKKSSKGKYIYVALISTALVALLGVGIVLIEPAALFTIKKDPKQVSIVEDPVLEKLKKDSIDNSKMDDSDTKELPKQKPETADPKKQIVQNENDTPLLENSGSTKRVAEENGAIIPDNSVIIAKNNELPKEEQKIEKTTEVEKPVEQKPLKISDILSIKKSAEVPVVEEKKVSQPEVLPEVVSLPEAVPEVVSLPEVLPEVTSQPEVLPEVIPESKIVSKATPKPRRAPKSRVAPKPRSKPKKNINNASVPSAIMLEENAKSNPNTEGDKKEAETDVAKAKSTKKAKREQNSFFDMFAKKTQYYIQVGTDPSPALLSKLENAKLKYLVTRNKGKYKTVVGPYSSMRNAKSAIRSIKKSAKINGILVKMKTK